MLDAPGAASPTPVHRLRLLQHPLIQGVLSGARLAFDVYIKTFGEVVRGSLAKLKRCVEAGDAEYGVLWPTSTPVTASRSVGRSL